MSELNKKMYYRTLLEFLESVKITDKQDKSYTHTSMGDLENNKPPCKYKIPPNKYEFFYNLYNKWIFQWGEEESLTERHHEEYSPVLIDLDFRYNDSDNKKRKYKIDDLMLFLDYYFELLSNYLDIDESQKVAFIMEKSGPSFDKKKNIMKDGIHIIMPYIISKYDPLFLVRLDMIKNLEIKQKFIDLGFTNPIEDIIDEAVIKRNNWFMYGSSKPNKESYKITNILKIEDGILKIDELSNLNLTDLELTKLLSVSNINTKYICNIKNKEEVSKKIKKIEGNKKKSRVKLI